MSECVWHDEVIKVCVCDAQEVQRRLDLISSAWWLKSSWVWLECSIFSRKSFSIRGSRCTSRQWRLQKSQWNKTSLHVKWEAVQRGNGTNAGQVITTTENTRRHKAEGLEPSTRWYQNRSYKREGYQKLEFRMRQLKGPIMFLSVCFLTEKQNQEFNLRCNNIMQVWTVDMLKAPYYGKFSLAVFSNSNLCL